MMKSVHPWTLEQRDGQSVAQAVLPRAIARTAKSDPGRAAPRFFPPEVVVQVKAIACELPATLGVPLSRLSSADIVREAQRSGIVATLSDRTVWRWLHEDAIRPWQHRTWIFPRDPQFISKAGRILDLYARHWEDRPLRDDEFVLSADEKTSIQARIRKHASLPPRPGQSARVEHEYARGGAWAYLGRDGCSSREVLRPLRAVHRH